MRQASETVADKDGGPSTANSVNSVRQFKTVHQFFGEHLLLPPDELCRMAASAVGPFVPDGSAHANMNESRDVPQPDSEDLLSMAELVKTCSLIIGLHPDQVTDSIVDVAIASGKPFAVVPCCVFSRQFPERRTPAGDRVTTHDSLIEYLVAKHASVRKQSLPFDGCNTVVFSTGYCA
jgi:hypothetical protein